MADIVIADISQWIYWIAGGLLFIAAFLAIIRLTLGPTTLDRAVAIDLLTAVAIGVTALLIVWWNRGDLMVLMIVFALTGFFSSVAIAKYSGKENAAERRVLSKEEARLREEMRLRIEEERAAREKAGIEDDGEEAEAASDKEDAL